MFDISNHHLGQWPHGGAPWHSPSPDGPSCSRRSPQPQHPPYGNAAPSGDPLPSLTQVPGEPLHFTLHGILFALFFEGVEEPTHAYFRRVEPRVVLGGVDSGVANPGRADGTTLLDEVWAGRRSPGRARW
jgi:hypothetical protein